MRPVDYIVLAVIALAVALSAFFIYRARKNGQKCVGCPHSKTCGSCTCGKEGKQEH